MLDNIAGAVKDEKIYLFMDNAGYHKNELVVAHMKKLNIEPIYNVIPEKVIIEVTSEDGKLVIHKESKQVNKLSISYPKGTRSSLKVRTFDKIGEGLTFFLENYMDY